MDARVDLNPIARLADEACAITALDLPATVLHAAKRCVIDWYATISPGTVDAPAQSLEQGLADELGHGQAWTLSGRRGAARPVALINATASHTVEFDDIFAPAIYHPGSPTIAAALAMAETRGASGLAFLKAVIAGYEISTRIGIALGRPHYQFWHNTGTVGTFGAAIAAGLLAGLDANQMRHALAIAANMAAGLQQAFRGDTQTKPLHAGHAADAGMIAVAQAGGGVKGALDILEAPAGMGAAMSADVDWTAALADLGDLERHADDGQKPWLLRPYLPRFGWRLGASGGPWLRRRGSRVGQYRWLFGDRRRDGELYRRQPAGGEILPPLHLSPAALSTAASASTPIPPSAWPTCGCAL